MRVLLIVAVLLLVAVSGAALVPVAEPIRPYLSEATLALAVLTVIAVFLQRRQTEPPRKPAVEPGAHADRSRKRKPRRRRNRQLPGDAPGKGPAGRFPDGRHQPL